MSLYLGIDFGTSGARAIAINSNKEIQAQISQSFSEQSCQQWQTALFILLEKLPEQVRSRLTSICINGTSSTVLLCDGKGIPLTDPMLYNDARGASVLDAIQQIAPKNHTVISATSSLAKLMWWKQNFENFDQVRYFLHQADWLGFLLHEQLGISDYHNSLKLGYDVEQLVYPDWMPFQELLPQVVEPGSAIAPVRSELCDRFNIPATCHVCAGTTDSIAAFLASQVSTPGDAVTSLGSTLVLKLLSQTRLENSDFGIYSHRLGNLWLVGGASNTGGAVLKQFFSDAELMELSQQIQVDRESLLDYYPLLKPGERFPINDSNLLPRLDPQPNSRVGFLHGLLESMARIEARGYRLLQSEGASPLRQVLTAGGGSKNSTWTTIRSRHLGVPVLPASQTEAAFGSALLAFREALLFFL
jgi:D-ribulokinase